MKKSIFAIFTLILTVFCFLTFRIFILVAGVGKSVAAVAENQSEKSIVLHFSRGNIYDRDGIPLTNRQKGIYALVNPLYAKSDYALLSACKYEDAGDIVSAFSAQKPFLTPLLSLPTQKSGIDTFSLPVRYDGNTALHILGYTENGVGKSGIELAFDQHLKGDVFLVSYYTDALGRAVFWDNRSLSGSVKDIKSGVTLTLSEKWQKICDDAADKYMEKGAVVLLDLESGGIAALCSRPLYDRDNIGSARNDALMCKPLFAYNVGSSFKIIDSALYLAKGGSKDKKFFCGGSVSVSGRIISCNEEKGHGLIDMQTAFKESCNVYFIKLALSVGSDDLLSFTERCRLTESISLCDGITVRKGTLPTEKELLSNIALANFSIGQGSLLATPVRITALSACIANGGIYKEPYLIENIINSDGSITKSARQKSGRIMDESVANEITSFMISVANDGSGKRAKPENLTVAVKTATAQTGIQGDDGGTVLQGWVTGFFPAENPRFALTVLCEDAESGAKNAGPVFKEIASHYLSEIGM